MLNEKKLYGIKKEMTKRILNYTRFYELSKEEKNDFVDFLNNNDNEIDNKIIEIADIMKKQLKNYLCEEGKKKLPQLKELYLKWQNKVDKIMEENNCVDITAEHEFYDHLTGLYKWIKDGNMFEDMFGDAEDYENCDYLMITYDYIVNIMDAINNCYYIFYEDTDGKTMFIDYENSWYLREDEENISKVDMM